ncbi:MAG: DUF4340 domain-containing protein [Gammaproteobacteria bacterium]|nr:DUF4340 domain-containing protein [Gammaproteobacteria bacterium]
MTKNIRFLFIVLLVQVSVIAYLWFQDTDIDSFAATQSLLSVNNLSEIDKVEINEGDKKLVLMKKEGQWLLSDYHELPVNRGLVNSLLDTLFATKLSWYVTRTKSSAERFHTGVDNSKRHIILYADGARQAELFFGDSSGLNSIYVRRQSEDEIYNIKLKNYLLSVKENDWLDKNLLQIRAEVNEISGAGFRLLKNNKKWQLEDLKPGEEINKEEVELLIRYLEKIQVMDVASVINKKPDLTFILKAKGKHVEYYLYKNDKTYVIKSSLIDQFFKIAPYFYESLEKLQRQNFLKK